MQTDLEECGAFDQARIYVTERSFKSMKIIRIKISILSEALLSEFTLKAYLEVGLAFGKKLHIE